MNFRVSEPQKSAKNPDMIVFELEKKKQKLCKILETLKEMKLLQNPVFQSVKELIFEGIEKLAFSVSLREFQLNNNRKDLTFSKHDNIVRKVLNQWEELKLISSSDATNLGAFYSKIDNVEDFLFQVCLMAKEQAKNFTKYGNFDEMILIMDYFIEFFDILHGVRERYEEDYVSSMKQIWVSKEKAYFKENLINFLIANLLLNLINLKAFLGNVNENFLKKYGKLCKNLIKF